MHVSVQAFCTAKAVALSPKTVVWYRIQLGAFGAWLDAQGGDWMAATSIEQYYSYLRTVRRLQPSSVRGAHRALSAFYGWLIKRRLIARNPISDVEAPRVPKKQRGRAAPGDYESLLRSIPLDSNWVNARDYLLVSTLFLAGLRVAELTRLTIDDFDITNRLLIIRSRKGGDDHIIPLLEPVTRAFIAYLYARPATECAEVFLASDGGPGSDGVLTPNGVRQRLTKLCERAGIARLTPHKFRHGLARYMLDKGADMALIQRILGHQRMSTTSEIYALWDNLAGVSSQYKAVMAEMTRPQGKR